MRSPDSLSDTPFSRFSAKKPVLWGLLPTGWPSTRDATILDLCLPGAPLGFVRQLLLCGHA